MTRHMIYTTSTRTFGAMTLAAAAGLAGCDQAADSRNGANAAARAGQAPAAQADSPAVASHAAVVVDGVFDDWAGAVASVTDPAGDSNGRFDVVALGGSVHDGALYLRLDLAEAFNTQAGEAGDGTVIVRIADARGGRVITMDLREKEYRSTGVEPAVRTWEDLSYVCAPTVASTSFEMRADLSRMGLAAGDEVLVTLAGADELARPLRLVYQPDDGIAPVARDLPMPAEGGVRVASLNTERGGLKDARRLDAIGRMLRATSPDVICFQEEWQTTADEAVAAVNDVMGSDGAWNVYKYNGCLIATRGTITPALSVNDRYAAAGVELPDGRRVLVLSIHPKCCGFAGSSEDRQRIAQTQHMIETIERVRATTEGELAAFAAAPVVVTGDWNLVGSRVPLDMLTTSAEGPGLTHARLMHLDGRGVETYYSPGSDFGPGMLDLMAYDDERLAFIDGFVLDTRRLSDEQLSSHSLERGDSEVSDHMLLVADFAWR